jgi:hypothetical protein
MTGVNNTVFRKACDIASKERIASITNTRWKYGYSIDTVECECVGVVRIRRNVVVERCPEVEENVILGLYARTRRDRTN